MSRPLSRTAKTLVIAACHFGWGSLGKLRLILEELPPHRLILYDMPPMTTKILSLEAMHHEIVSSPPATADAALVINDPGQANALVGLGLAVVYVDSLPYMWASVDEVPAAGTTVVYCAQRYPKDVLPLAACLASRPDLRWVDPIVPGSHRRTGGAGVLVNVGGVHSHLSGDNTFDYVELVLPGVLDGLAEAGVQVAGVCGNIGGDWEAEVKVRFGNAVATGVQSGSVFERLLKSCDLLVTSPGSTTVLHAMQIDLPTLLLPPQNLSQILNAQLYLRADSTAFSWPESVLSMPSIAALRPMGEEAVVHAIYSALSKARRDELLSNETTEYLRSAFNPIQAEGHTCTFFDRDGARGAHQVAQIVRQVCLAPFAFTKGSS
ncbi:hypothetical protein E2K80_04805 [Rhodophyticola sp. CCM32]|nr:hypothetical protein E2K80_04805 [Rhodophyticola sp. CCM32]